MVFKKIPKYQTQKSTHKGIQKKRKDGIYASKPNAKGVYQWTKKAKGKHYDIHDNGGRPFRVFINGLTVRIYKAVNKESPITYTKQLKELKVKKVFIGKSTRGDHTPAEAKTFTGNTILLHVSGKKYMYIGPELYEFEMDDAVDAYFSMVGRNDVPYPVVLGKENVYFMLDHTYVPRDKFPAITTKPQWEDAYSYYYGYLHAETGEESSLDNRIQKQAKKMNKIRMIHSR
jgi:hypothetical protein